MLKMAFLYQVALHEPKKQPFSANQKFSIYRKLYALPSKASRFRNQNTARSNNFYCPQKLPFHVQKPFFCTNLSLLPYKEILFCPPPPLPTALNLLSAKNSHFHKPKVFLLHKSFLKLLSKAILFHPPSPIRTTLNLLFAKNAAVLLMFA